MRDEPALRQDTRRSSTTMEKAIAHREVKGMSTCGGPGVRPVACGERVRVLDLRSHCFCIPSTCSKHGANVMKPVRLCDEQWEVGVALK